MRTTRKFLALLLAVAMVFTMTAMTALATGGDDGTTTPDGGAPTTSDGDITPGGGTTPDGDLTAPGDPTPDGGASTTPDGGASTTPDGGAPTTPDTPTPPGVSEQAQAVIALIEALPDFNTLGLAEAVEAFEAQVFAARAAYNELTLEQQEEVTNIAKLTQAEAYLTGPTNITPRETYVCQIEGGGQFDSLEAAVAAVKDDVPTTITMLTNVEITGEITIPKNKNITLDMAGHTITPAAGFKAGRAFENKGTFTIKGNGTIDMTGAGANGYGTVNNFGRLTVEDGKYIGHVDANASNFYNRNGGTAIFINPEINGGAVCIATEIKTTTEIRGGIYTDELYPAIENRGEMTITGGTFKNTSCSACSSNWGYTIRSGESAENAYLKIQGTTENSVKVTGVQGGLAIIGGTADIYNGFYKTIHCVKDPTHNSSSYYAGYFTGESHETSTNIYGGTFKSYSRTAVLIGNSNEPPDSGEGEKSTVMIHGGEFIGGDTGKTAITVENTAYAKGAAEIFGGKFSSDVKEYITGQYDQLVTNKETDTPFWVGKYNDSGAANTMGQTVYKVIYKFDGKSVDVYYMTEAEANKAIKEAEEAGENVVTKEPVAVTPTPSGGGGGSGSLPVILSPVWNQTVSVIEHSTLTMSVRASRASSYQWFVDRGDGRFVAIAGATGPSLTIWPDMGDNGNRYYCQAMNGYGGVDSPYFTLCVVRSTLPPKTGDQVSVTLWVCLMALGVAGALTAWNRQKNR